jgi:hypothetical protein
MAKPRSNGNGRHRPYCTYGPNSNRISHPSPRQITQLPMSGRLYIDKQHRPIFVLRFAAKMIPTARLASSLTTKLPESPGSANASPESAVGLLPDALASPLARLEHYGMLILIGLLLILPLVGAQFGLDLSVVSRLVGTVTNEIIGMILWITGHT